MRPVHFLATAAALAAALAVGACGPSEPADSTGAKEAFGSGPTTSAGPPATPSPTAPPAPAPSGPGQVTAEPPPAPDYPTTARAYAEAVVAAWQQNQVDTLGDLATPGVQEQIIEIPGPLNMDWSFTRCDGTAGSSYCMFANAVGDVLTLRISHTLLGQPHAATEVRLDARA